MNINNHKFMKENDMCRCKSHHGFFSTSSSGASNAKRVLMLILVCSSALQTASADLSEPRDTVFYSAPPTPEDLGQHLFPAASSKELTRSITFKKEQETTDSQKSVSMPVLFHFGKTTIVEQSRAFLDSVGEMLVKEEYADRTLIVEGHTDAVGTVANNQRLSELRALAIKDYLVNNYGIDPYRLFPDGKGESRLYNAEKPEDGSNRRVEFLPYR